MSEYTTTFIETPDQDITNLFDWMQETTPTWSISCDSGYDITKVYFEKEYELTMFLLKWGEFCE